jgi:hypothetical protein
MKKYLKILSLSVLIIPSVAFASWWNPFSWSSQKDIEGQMIDNKIIENNKIKSDNDSYLESRIRELEEKMKLQPTTTQIIKAEKENLPEPKVITKTVQVDNPELQKRIKDLEKENLELKNKLISQDSVLSQLNICKADLAESRSSIGATNIKPTESQQCIQAKELYKISTDQKFTLEEQKNKDIEAA